MYIKEILSSFEKVKEKELKDRFFKHPVIERLIVNLPVDFTVSQLGQSFENRSINLVKWGKGSIKVMLWSQMHGDEATGTMALFDLFNFLQTTHPLVKILNDNCELFVIPMVNPDGATAFIRRNAQQIDINRDFLKAVSPEARWLKHAQYTINPDFGFNLHDQSTLWSVSKSLQPATLSLLAPAFDEQLNINETRQQAMLVIAQMFADIDPILPEQIGLFDDEFEPRAFGDNFQKAGMSTILIEAGGYGNDFEKQEIRKFYFGSIVSGLQAIAQKLYEKQTAENYFAIPKNNKQIFHILIHQLQLNGIEVSIGINYEECPTGDGCSTVKNYIIQDIGDLSFCKAYQQLDSEYLRIEGKIEIFKDANFKLFDGQELILSFENGKLL